MSSIMDGLREPSPRSRFLWWWQHHPWVLALVEIVLWVPAFALPGAWGWLFTALATIFAIVMTVSVSAHSRAILCPGCSFTLLPDDPDTEVKRYTPRLRRFHRFLNLMDRLYHFTGARQAVTGLIFMLLYLAVWYGMVVFGMITIGPHQQFPAGLVAAIVIGAYFSTLGITHSRLMNWCPWCRDEGGDDEEVFEPVPDPSEDHQPDPDPVHM